MYNYFVYVAVDGSNCYDDNDPEDDMKLSMNYESEQMLSEDINITSEHDSQLNLPLTTVSQPATDSVEDEVIIESEAATVEVLSTEERDSNEIEVTRIDTESKSKIIIENGEVDVTIEESNEESLDDLMGTHNPDISVNNDDEDCKSSAELLKLNSFSSDVGKRLVSFDFCKWLIQSYQTYRSIDRRNS